MSEDLIKAKQGMKKKLPKFRRVEKHRHPALPDNWRKPKGHHSKIRRAKKWEMRIPKIGMKTPKKLQHLNKEGKELIKINAVNDLKKLTDKTIGVLVSGLGLKKKALIAKEAAGKKYKFLNFNPERIIQKLKDRLSKKEKPVVAEKIIKESGAEAKKPSKPLKEEKPLKPSKEIKDNEKPKKPIKGEK